jgi:hypothetical protein
MYGLYADSIVESPQQTEHVGGGGPIWLCMLEVLYAVHSTSAISGPSVHKLWDCPISPAFSLRQ